jgi:hypothetical protein
MRRARPRAALPGLAAVAVLVAACGGGHTAKLTQAERDCNAVTQAANTVQLVTPLTAADKVTPDDVSRARSGADALTSAASAATTDVAGPGGQLAAVARAYADAMERNNIEAINVDGGLMRQRAQSVADTCKTSVLGIAPNGPANATG